MPTTTEPSPDRAQPPVPGLSSLAVASAKGALRIVAVLVLLAAIVVAGAPLRAQRAAGPGPPHSPAPPAAADPSPPNPADERAYLVLAHDLATTGNYGGPGSEMDDPLH